MKIGIVTTPLLHGFRDEPRAWFGVPLALWLAKNSFKVTVLSLFPDPKLQNFLEENGIAFTLVGALPYLIQRSENIMRSDRIYRQIREAGFDAVHFPDAGGLPFLSVQAKAHGIAFAGTKLITHIIRPSEWFYRNGVSSPEQPSDLSDAYGERRSAELADALWLSQVSDLNRLKQAGWKLPQAFISGSVETSPAEVTSAWNEILFAGELSALDGFDLFCDMLDDIPAQHMQGKSVRFISTPGRSIRMTQKKYIKARCSRWPFAYSTASVRSFRDFMSSVRSTGCAVFFPFGRTFDTTLADLMTANKVRVVGPKGMERIESGQRVSLRDYEEILSSAGKSAQKTKNQNPESPWVTVCVTHKDRAGFLEQSLSSLAAQTYSNLKILVVDDGSKKAETKKYLATLERNWSGTQNRVMLLDQSVGPGAARNLAARTIDTEWLLYMDDDNIAKPHEIETLVEIQRRTGADFVTCAFDRFEGEAPDNPTRYQQYRWVPTGPDLNQAFFDNTLGDTNALYRRSALLDIGGFSEQKSVGWEDYHVFLKGILKGYRLETCHEALFWYRDHKSNRSKKIDRYDTIALRTQPWANYNGFDLSHFAKMLLAWGFRKGLYKDGIKLKAPEENGTSEHPERRWEKRALSGIRGKGTKKALVNSVLSVAFSDSNSYITLEPKLSLKSDHRLVIEILTFKEGEASADLGNGRKQTLPLRSGNNTLSWMTGTLSKDRKIHISPSEQSKWLIRSIEIVPYESTPD